MSPGIWVLVAVGLLAGGSVFLATACYSLRNFSRSRLASVCKAGGDMERFGDILKQDESALASCEMLLVFALAPAIALLAWRFDAGPQTFWATMAAELLAITVVAVLLLVVAPLSIANVFGESILFRCWPVIRFLTLIARPLTYVSWRIDTLFHRIAGRRDPEPDTVETFTDELQSVVDEGEREGLVESRSGRMIQRVMELREDDVRAVMTPRTDIVVIPSSADWDQARSTILESGHSRIPVVEGTPDKILGILYARDLLEHSQPETTGRKLTEIVRTPRYVPESTSIDYLLERMKRERFHMAVVLDEYGGVAGLVTLEDILEEIVGEIADEFDDDEEEQIHRINDDTTDVDARVRVDDLNEIFDYGLPEESDFDTVGGFVFSKLGHVPAPNETFTWRNLQFTVLDADERRIGKLRIHIDRKLVATEEER